MAVAVCGPPRGPQLSEDASDAFASAVSFLRAHCAEQVSVLLDAPREGDAHALEVDYLAAADFDEVRLPRGCYQGV